MQIPLVYVLDNDPAKIRELSSSLMSEETIEKCLPKLEASLDSEDIEIFSKVFKGPPSLVYLLANPNDSSDVYITDKKLELISNVFSHDKNKPAILLLDLALLDHESLKLPDDIVNANCILDAYEPSDSRIWVLGSSIEDADRQKISKNHLKFKARLNAPIGESGSPAYFFGAVEWWERNKKESIYNEFFQLLTSKWHQWGPDEVMGWLYSNIPILNSLSDNGKSKLRSSMFELAAKRSVSLDVAYILVLIVCCDVVGDVNEIAELFDIKQLDNFYSVDDYHPIIFLNSHRAEDRKHVLFVFGELYRRLLICDPRKNLSCCTKTIKLTLQEIVLMRNLLKMKLCFKSKKLCEYVRLATNQTIAENNRLVSEAFPYMVFPECSAVEGLHETATLLNAFRLALALTDKSVNDGVNILGSGVLLKVILDENCNSTVVSFNG